MRPARTAADALLRVLPLCCGPKPSATIRRHAGPVVSCNPSVSLEDAIWNLRRSQTQSSQPSLLEQRRREIRGVALDMRPLAEFGRRAFVRVDRLAVEVPGGVAEHGDH